MSGDTSAPGSANPLASLTLLIGVNAGNRQAVNDLDPFIRQRDVLVVEEGHVARSVFDASYLYGMAENLKADYPTNRVFIVARPHHLPLTLPQAVDCVLIDHEESSYDEEWPGRTFPWGWGFPRQLEMVALLRQQDRAGLISPPPIVSLGLDVAWDWFLLGQGFVWHNVMCQRAAQVSRARWNGKAAFLADQHGGLTENLSMQITMKRDAARYAPPSRVIGCCGEYGARINGVPNVLLFGAHPDDLTQVLTGLRVPLGG